MVIVEILFILQYLVICKIEDVLKPLRLSVIFQHNFSLSDTAPL